MRVGIDLAPLSYGNRARGIGTYAENLVRALAALDSTNKYVLVTARGTDGLYTPPFPLPPNFSLVTLASLPLGRATPLLTHQLVLPLQLRGERLDVFHTPGVPFNPSHPGVPFSFNVSQVVTFHDLLPLQLGEKLLQHERYRRFYEFQLGACRRAAHVITGSEASKRELVDAAKIARDKITVIPYGTPPLATDDDISAP